MHRTKPPATVEELLDRARALEGITLAEVAEGHGMRAPPDLKRHKGWIGDLAEVALGATAGSNSEPDFPALGVELKTIPLDARGMPRESTWVCSAPIDGSDGRTWAESWAWHKLQCVLWLPVVTLKDVPVPARTFGAAQLWRPTIEQQALLKADWESATEALALGEFWRANGKHGEVLQLRSKALRADRREWAIDSEANWVRTTPYGFYLRAAFTRTVLAGPREPSPA